VRTGATVRTDAEQVQGRGSRSNASKLIERAESSGGLGLLALVRADVAQYWVHPGVIQSVLNDARISVSGAGVEAAAGGDPLGLLR